MTLRILFITNKLSIFIWGCILISLCACTENTNPPEPLYSFEKGSGYFVINEGGFTKGNASIDYIFEGQDSILTNIFENANGSKIGDVLQSVMVSGNTMYMAVNNSGWIKAVEIETFEEITTITGFIAPRYIQKVDDTKAFVSDQFAGKIWVLDLMQHKIVDSIELEGWTEEMVLMDEKVYVTSPSTFGGPTSKNVYVIDANENQLIETIELRANPFNLERIGDKILVFCQGDPFASPSVAPSIHMIDPSDHSNIPVKLMPNLPTAYHSRLAKSNDGETMYLLYGGIFDIDIFENGVSYSSVPLVEALGRSFYGLAVHPVTGNLFVSDAADYSSSGTVYEYKTNAIKVKDFKTGIIPSHFIWY